jgi:esterase/lipase superfamily enzyme
LRSNQATVLYVTDRAPTEVTDIGQQYGHGRSRSLAFGEATVQFGRGLTWEQLVEASRTDKREVKVPILITNVTEITRFPDTPARLIVPEDGIPLEPEEWKAHLSESEKIFRETVAARLAETDDKEAYVFVHGFANQFNGSCAVMAQMYHFLGRRGVPIAYSWPAGSKGLKSYAYDRESGEFTNYHLKQFIRLLATVPGLQRINVIAHSRGTSVATVAIIDLHGESRARGEETREKLKLGLLELAAPDMDMDVFVQNFLAERLSLAVEQLAIYVCPRDEAIGISGWLFSDVRLGRLKSDYFPEDELHHLRESHHIQIIDAEVTKPGSFGHNYFYVNPEVSSDVLLLLEGHPPGAEHGRPLLIHETGFWGIHDDYPNPPKD